MAEIPKGRQSTVTETEAELRIAMPKRKSWVLVVFMALLILQFLNGLIQSLFFAEAGMPVEARAIMVPVSLIGLYFSLREFIWQLKGKKEIVITQHELSFRRHSPIWSKTRTFHIPDVKMVETRDESIAEGPLAMLQLLGIRDRVRIEITVGYETITTLSGMDRSEASELQELLRKRLKHS